MFKTALFRVQNFDHSEKKILENIASREKIIIHYSFSFYVYSIQDDSCLEKSL